ncbi:MAG: hypothetical protein ACK4GJ_01785 [bacterium]
MKDKKGVLLLTTLFFVVVLIMMSISLFILTKNNFNANRDFWARQIAMNNAENSIQTLIFLISHTPESFMLRNNSLIFPPAESKFMKIFSSDQYRTILSSTYNLIIINLNPEDNFGNSGNSDYYHIVSNNPNITNSIDINELQGKEGIIILFGENNRSIVEQGSIIFFGNYINDSDNSSSATNVYYNDNNNTANTIAIRFDTDKIIFKPRKESPNEYLLYSSYNRSTLDNEVNVNGNRRIESFGLDIMAMGYSKVPNTNRYVVNYVDWQFVNSGLGQYSSFISDGSVTITADKLEVGTYESHQQSNIFYANIFSNITLKEDNNKYTKFYTVKQTDSGNTTEYGGIRGKIIAKSNDNHLFKYNNRQFNLIDGQNGIINSPYYQQIKEFVGAEFSNKTIDSNFDKLRNSLLNDVKSKFKDDQYLTLDPGYYIFVNPTTIVYFPPNYSYSSINAIISASLLIDNQVSKDYLNNRAPDAKVYESYIVQNQIYMQDYNLVIKNNVKLQTPGSFIHITSWKEQSSRDRRRRKDNFGVIDVGVNLLEGSILWYDKGAIVIDGIVSSDPLKGGAIIATKDNDSQTTIHRAPVYNKDNSSPITEYWAPYSADYYGNLLREGKNNQNITGEIKQGDIVTRFSQIYQGTQKVAILADNNLYINPLSKNFASDTNTTDPTNPSEPPNLLEIILNSNSNNFQKIKENGEQIGNYTIYTGKDDENIVLVLSDSEKKWKLGNSDYTNNYINAAIKLEYEDVDYYFIFELWIYNSFDSLSSANSNTVNLKVYKEDSEVYSGSIEFSGNNSARLARRFMDIMGAYLGITFQAGNTPSPETDQNQLTGEYLKQALLVSTYAFLNNKPEIIKEIVNNNIVNNKLPITLNTPDYSNGTSLIKKDKLEEKYKLINQMIAESQKQAEKEKEKRGKKDKKIENTDVKITGLVLVGNDLRGITGKNNNLWFTGMVMTKGNVNIGGTNEVDFFFDPDVINLDFLQGATVLYKNYRYRIYDSLK